MNYNTICGTAAATLILLLICPARTTHVSSLCQKVCLKSSETGNGANIVIRFKPIPGQTPVSINVSLSPQLSTQPLISLNTSKGYVLSFFLCCVVFFTSSRVSISLSWHISQSSLLTNSLVTARQSSVDSKTVQFSLFTIRWPCTVYIVQWCSLYRVSRSGKTT